MTLHEMLVDEIKDLYHAEKQLTKALPKMIRKASSRELQRAFTTHLRETERQAKRLERICRDLGVSPKGKKCVGMEGLIDEAKELIDEKPDPDVLDAGLISKAQHVEHYEMAGYGTVRTYAELLGKDEHVSLLERTLQEEEQADELLTELAESHVNEEALVRYRQLIAANPKLVYGRVTGWGQQGPLAAEARAGHLGHLLLGAVLAAGHELAAVHPDGGVPAIPAGAASSAAAPPWSNPTGPCPSWRAFGHRQRPRGRRPGRPAWAHRAGRAARPRGSRRRSPPRTPTTSGRCSARASSPASSGCSPARLAAPPPPEPRSPARS